MGRPGPVVGGGEAPVDAGDWRSQLLPDVRQRIVNKILAYLPLSGQEEKAARFEERIYASATSQHDYLRKITLKILQFQTKFQNTTTDSRPSNSE